MTKVEYLNEGWIKFQRHPCKVGFIDVWIGDSADNPNNPTKMNYNLNSFSKAYRLNGKGEWKYDLPFGKKQELEGLLNIMRDVCSSEEIWSIVF
jgi:hypothetical protein